MNDEFSYIEDNIARLRERIEKCAVASGRDPDEITIVGVTKTVGIGQIKRMTACGINILGENKVQDLLEKYDAISGCEWHMIGHLQKNKAKCLTGKVALIHSVDSIELVEELDRRAAASGNTFDILIQINAAGEETKSGISPEEVEDFIGITSSYKNVKITGFMTMAPFIDDQKMIGRLFENIYKIYIDMQNKNVDNVNIKRLSMGMSNDFETAIREGSNMIRIGTAIFGQRK